MGQIVNVLLAHVDVIAAAVGTVGGWFGHHFWWQSQNKTPAAAPKDKAVK